MIENSFLARYYNSFVHVKIANVTLGILTCPHPRRSEWPLDVRMTTNLTSGWSASGRMSFSQNTQTVLTKTDLCNNEEYTIIPIRSLSYCTAIISISAAPIRVLVVFRFDDLESLLDLRDARNASLPAVLRSFRIILALQTNTRNTLTPCVVLSRHSQILKRKVKYSPQREDTCPAEAWSKKNRIPSLSLRVKIYGRETLLSRESLQKQSVSI